MSSIKLASSIILLSLFLGCSQQQNNPDTVAPTATFAISQDSLQDAPPPPAMDTTKAALTETTASEDLDEMGPFRFGYQLAKPNFKAKLPKELLEISALTYDAARKILLTVNDEKGSIFILDAKDCSFIEKIKFGSKGDYEGIEVVGNTAYILNANGKIIPFDLKKGKAGATFKTPLSTKNDVEGLGYDRQTNSLILACKGDPELSGASKLKGSKAFYSFNPSENVFKKQPKFVITDKDLETFVEMHLLNGQSKKDAKKLKKRIKDFSPSAIAEHPKDGHFYILSSVGKSLVVCNKEGRLVDIHFLNDKQFIQPEGICFSPSGTMYISNEGKSLVANILVFDYRP